MAQLVKDSVANGATPALQPKWMEQFRTQFLSGVAHAFVFHFNTRDYMARELPLRDYLAKALANKRVIAFYNLADGITFPKTGMREEFDKICELDSADAANTDTNNVLAALNMDTPTSGPKPLPKAPAKAIPLLETLLRNGSRSEDDKVIGEVAVVIEFAETIAPNADVSIMSPDDRAVLVTLERLGADKDLASRGNPLILVTENVSDLHPALRRASSKYEQIEIALPNIDERKRFIQQLLERRGEKLDDGLTVDALAASTAMLNRMHIEDVFLHASQDTGVITADLVRERKRSIIAAEFGEVIEVMEPSFTFADIGGLEHVKEFFVRSVIRPMKEGRYSRVPMGVLMTGPAGCLAKGTPVLMFDGSIKPVENVYVGDCLMGPDSNPRHVLRLARGREPMYRVTPQKGDSYDVNESHILSLKMSYGAGWHKKAEIVNMTVRDYLAKSDTFKQAAKGWRIGVEFPHRNVPLSPYYVGLWLGDGHSHHGNVITTADVEVVQFLHSFATAHNLQVKSIANTGKATTYQLTRADREGKIGGVIEDRRNYVRDTMRDLGLIQNKHIPEIYKVNDRETRLHLLAGLLDADGSLTDGGFDYITKSERLADDVVYLARSLGFSAYKHRSFKKAQSGGYGLYWRMFIAGNVNEIPVLLPRRKADERRQIKDVLVTGIQVKELGQGEYFGFEIDGDGLFLLGDFTVTHNTGKTIMAQAVAQESGMNCVILNPAKLFGQYVGNTERNLDRALRAIVAMSPTIVFMDEIDQVVNRGGGGDSGVSNRFFKRLLEFMSDTTHRGRVVFLAATNRPDLMDAALRRPGRFDRKIPFVIPNRNERIDIIRVMAKRYGLGDVELDVALTEDLQERTGGNDLYKSWTGAELEAATIKAFELTQDEGMTAQAALAQAVRRLRPSTSEIEFQTLLAMKECNDTDLLPLQYRERLADRAKLEEQIENAQPRGRNNREL